MALVIFLLRFIYKIVIKFMVFKSKITKPLNHGENSKRKSVINWQNSEFILANKFLAVD